MRYVVEIYCGRAYCGNAVYETFDECVEFFHNDGLCNRAKITELETGEVTVIRL